MQADNNHSLSWRQIKFQIQTSTHKLISKSNLKGTRMSHPRPIVHASICKSVRATTICLDIFPKLNYIKNMAVHIDNLWLFGGACAHLNFISAPLKYTNIFVILSCFIFILINYYFPCYPPKNTHTKKKKLYLLVISFQQCEPSTVTIEFTPIHRPSNLKQGSAVSQDISPCFIK